MNSFTDNYYRVYSAKKWTFEHFFCIFTYFVIFALPFYFCFASKSTYKNNKDFWFDEQFSLVDVEYTFTGYYAVELSYFNGAPQRSSFAAIPSSKITSQIQGLTFDVIDNEESSAFTFAFDNTFDSVTINSFNALFYYDVNVPSLGKTLSTAYSASF